MAGDVTGVTPDSSTDLLWLDEAGSVPGRDGVVVGSVGQVTSAPESGEDFDLLSSGTRVSFSLSCQSFIFVYFTNAEKLALKSVTLFLAHPVYTYIDDLSLASIDCLTPASRLRRSASV